MIIAMEDTIIGIDLGTTNSAVGAVDSGFPILLANEQQQRISPSVVWYGPNGEREVGIDALRRKNGGSGTVVSSAKRLIGQKLENIDSFPLPLTQQQGNIMIETVQGPISPIDVSAAILQQLKQIAKQRLEHKVSRAVITVPAYFNDSQRAATKLAGEKAGLTVERILSEPTAAALAFGLDKLQEKARVIVYDLGGGTFDVTLLEMNDGVFQVESTSGDTQLGGDDIDLELAQYAWKKHGGTDFDRLDGPTLTRLLDEARRIKESLSSVESASFTIPFIRPTENLQVDISRDTFDSLIEPLIQRTLKHCRQVLLDGEINDPQNQLSNVILVGGSSRIPAIQQATQDFFAKEIDLSQHPDEAIALGAVIQGGILSGALKNMVLLDVTPLSLGIETYGGLMNVIIPRNSTIPCKAGEMFTNAVDEQKEMAIRVLQGEREMAKDNWLLGKLSIPFHRERKGQARVGVQFSIDENGILEVLTRDTKTQQDTILKIKSAAVDVEDDKVEAMISESIDFAFDDMSERVFTEAKLKADELLPAVAVALQQLGSEIDQGQREAIEAAVKQVEQQILTHDANALKKAVQQLDKATEELATLLVEKAMQDALMRKLED